MRRASSCGATRRRPRGHIRSSGSPSPRVALDIFAGARRLCRSTRSRARSYLVIVLTCGRARRGKAPQRCSTMFLRRDRAVRGAAVRATALRKNTQYDSTDVRCLGFSPRVTPLLHGAGPRVRGVLRAPNIRGRRGAAAFTALESGKAVCTCARSSGALASLCAAASRHAHTEVHS
jgi:hypothetical protein